MSKTKTKKSDKRRLMFFSAHPDDEIGAAGGLILKTLKAGGNVKLVLCVDPSQPRPEINAEKEKFVRLGEFNKVAKKIGADSSFLNLPRYPELSLENVLACVSEIRSFKPDIVAMIHEEDYHTEHSQVARIVKRAVWHAGRGAFPECGLPHKVQYLYEVEGDRPMSEPNHLEDISEVVEAKHKLFLLYSSQQARKDLASAFLGLNKFRGIMYKKGTAAEAYKVTDFFYG